MIAMKAEPRKIRSFYFPGLLTTRQAARILGVSVKYVTRLRSLGLLSTVLTVHDEFGLMSEDAVRAYLAAHPFLGSRRKKPA